MFYAAELSFLSCAGIGLMQRGGHGTSVCRTWMRKCVPSQLLRELKRPPGIRRAGSKPVVSMRSSSSSSDSLVHASGQFTGDSKTNCRNCAVVTSCMSGGWVQGIICVCIAFIGCTSAWFNKPVASLQNMRKNPQSTGVTFESAATTSATRAMTTSSTRTVARTMPGTISRL